MTNALVVALLLSAEAPEFHGGGAVNFGLGAPFRNGNAGFQLGVKGFIDFTVAPKISVGAALPFGFGFYSATTFGANVSFTVVDIMPSLRGTLAVIDWISAAVELGLGPSILTTNVYVPFLNMSQTDTRTSFAMRVALGVEIAPPALSGVLFTIEPVAIHGRFGDNTFSEYRFSVGVGYRR